MKKVLSVLITLGLASFASQANAETLVEVYQQARASNPDLKKNETERNIAHEKINEARGNLLPTIGIGGNLKYTHGFRDADDQNEKTRGISASLTQPIFDLSIWKSYTISQKQAAIQDISYQIQEQSLILNTAVAYFDVLRSLDAISFIEAQKKAIYRQLDQTRQRHKVGLLPIMDVQNAQAEYDQTVAQEVNAKNDLDNALEKLRQVTGRHYGELTTIDDNRFKTERLTGVNDLLQLAENNNLNLLAARGSQEIAKEQINLANTGHYPTVALEASSGIIKDEKYGNSVPLMYRGSANNGGNSIGATVTLPIYAGGRVVSKAKQAQQAYQGSIDQTESVKRDVEKNVRSFYNNIVASTSAIKAYEQTVVSAESSLKATQSSYDVGTRTIVDVLNSTTTLYSAKQKLSDSKFNYLTSILQLKYALGTLSLEDLSFSDSMLGKGISTEFDIGL